MIVKQSKKVYHLNEKHIIISIKDGKVVLSKGRKQIVTAAVLPSKIKVIESLEEKI